MLLIPRIEKNMTIIATGFHFSLLPLYEYKFVILMNIEWKIICEFYFMDVNNLHLVD